MDKTRINKVFGKMKQPGVDTFSTMRKRMGKGLGTKGLFRGVSSF